jgi:hypothetical protein
MAGDVVIAKMDAIANENEKMLIYMFPKLVMYTKGNKNGIIYEGEREVDEIRKWIMEVTEEKEVS